MNDPPIENAEANGTGGSPFEDTRAFYNENALDYARTTQPLAVIPALDRFAQQLNSDEHVLDVGCGAGRDLAFFQLRGLRAVGLDYSRQLCAVARDHSGAKVIVGDLRRLPLSDRTFQGVSAVASLLHLRRSELPNALAEIYRVIKPGGALFTSIKQGSGWRQDSLGRWVTYFECKEWLDFLESAGFTSIETTTDLEVRVAKSLSEDIYWINNICKRSVD